jgi:hypothetical protein
MRRSDRRCGAAGRRPARLAALAVVPLLAMAACEVTRETSDGRPMPPPPTAAPATPAGAEINAIALIFGPKPVDIDSDGRADLVELDAYLFSRPYPSPTYAEGTLVFELFAPGGAGGNAPPLGTLRLGPSRLQAIESRSMFGACYRVLLSLREAGVPPSAPPSLDLRTTFEPADGGTPVSSRSVERIVLAGP